MYNILEECCLNCRCNSRNQQTQQFNQDPSKIENCLAHNFKVDKLGYCPKYEQRKLYNQEIRKIQDDQLKEEVGYVIKDKVKEQ